MISFQIPEPRLVNVNDEMPQIIKSHSDYRLCQEWVRGMRLAFDFESG